ncbi:Hypothetical predicted protein, partial [Pelobates cultripes]
MGALDLTRYYIAALMGTLLTTFHHTTPPPWHQIETAHTGGIAASTLAWIPKHSRPKYQNICPTTAATLLIWDRYVKEHYHTTYISPALQIQALHVLIPGFDYSIWYNSGITCLSQIMSKGRLLDYDSISKTFNLPSKAYFTYLQLRSWVKKHIGGDSRHQQDNNLTEIEKICMAKKPPQKLLSLLYKLSGTQVPPKALKFIKAWEKELDLDIPNEIWSKVLAAHKHLTLNTTHIETSRKVLYR